MGRDYIKITGIASLSSFILAFFIILFAILAPLIFGNAASGNALLASLQNLAPVAGMLLIILGCLLYVGVFLAAIYEVIKAKNSEDWKVIWGIVLLVFGLFGLALYLLIARKEIRR